MKVSIIIAVKADNPNLRECLQKVAKIHYEDYEVLVMPDQIFQYEHEKARVIPTGPCLPAKKRDIAAKEAKGEILAFLDDDAYPSEGWLSAAVKNFDDPKVAAVGGPAVTPPTEDLARRASGYVYESYLVSGTFRYRYVKGKRRFVDDYPSCNLLVRKDIFEEAGGFKTVFWPGEDTFLCLEITKRLKKKIAYDPDALVFHHRRPLFLPHLKQILNYGLHRGYFVKRYPETSLRWQYFVPSLLFLWFSIGLSISLFNFKFSLIYIVSILIYAFLIYISSRVERDMKMTRVVALGISLTHMTYGLYFLLGLVTTKLKEEE
ncbi:MAG TPA: glycosyl transferase [Candidatus Omnitrophica bacterium]|nr:glycosyl transferase [Candidatus Omnitrophota bacterium]